MTSIKRMIVFNVKILCEKRRSHISSYCHSNEIMIEEMKTEHL